MEALKFILSGNTACFKKPEVCTYYYFTYGHIHKVALMGIFGAIMGYGGYHQMEKKDKSLDSSYPEFYDKCKEINIAVVPNNKNGIIPKKIQSFNNSVGYASKEQGGNLIVKEQWLENPSWNIYLLLDCEVSKEIASKIQNYKSVYTPYLGKNDHLANIEGVEIIPLTEFKLKRGFLHSLYLEDIADYVVLDEDEEEELDCYVNYRYKEKLPIKLDEITNNYIMASFNYTDALLEIKDNQKIYSIGNCNLAFY